MNAQQKIYNKNGFDNLFFDYNFDDSSDLIPNVGFVVDRHQGLSITTLQDQTSTFIAEANLLTKQIFEFIESIEVQIKSHIRVICILAEFFGHNPQLLASSMLKELTSANNEEFQKYAHLIPQFERKKRSPSPQSFLEWLGKLKIRDGKEILGHIKF